MDPSLTGKLGNKLDETSATKVSREKVVPAGKPAEQSVPSDKVELTSNAKLLERLDKALASAPDIDEARISEIKTAIENGNYEIDSDAIAQAMLRFERQLGD
jgi:negative regulator of flagellin synthesis FlgM